MYKTYSGYNSFKTERTERAYTSSHYEKLLHHLRARRAGAGWVALCPLHDDSRNSFSFRTINGKAVFKCHATCSQQMLADKVFELLDRIAEGEQLPPLNRSKHTTRKSKRNDDAEQKRFVCAYDYTDEKGKLLYQVVRYAPKSFVQRRPEGTVWVYNLEGVRRVLYHLPEVAQSKVVLIFEGEKDAENAKRLLHIDGYATTTNACGACKWLPEYTDQLRHKHVVIIPDNDEAGERHCALLRSELTGKAASVVVVKIPSEYKDFSDWNPSANLFLDVLIIALDEYRKIVN